MEFETHTADDDAEAARILAEAEALVQRYNARIAAIREREDALDENFRVRARAEAEREAAEVAAYRLSVRRSIIAAEESRLSHIEAAERSLRDFVANISEALECNEIVRSLSRELHGDRVKLREFSLPDFVVRIGGRLASILQTVKIPGTHITSRIGAIELVGGSRYPADESWREAEERECARAVAEIVEE